MGIVQSRPKQISGFKDCFIPTHLRVGVEIADSLDVDDDELMPGPLEGEVRESLRSPSQCLVVDVSRVGVVLNIIP